MSTLHLPNPDTMPPIFLDVRPRLHRFAVERGLVVDDTTIDTLLDHIEALEQRLKHATETANFWRTRCLDGKVDV